MVHSLLAEQIWTPSVYLHFLFHPVFLGVSESICSVPGLRAQLLPAGILKGSEDTTPADEVVKHRC